ncbi:MAG: ribonuclease P protein component [Candidatus Moranbacteria bacterium]|nr:ribonuclease P protein component [Candidatus Moranbacteria bacterium]
MLKKRNRLTKKEIEFFFKSHPLKVTGKNLTLFYKKKESKFSRLAVVISKKTSKKAVVRKKIKRRCREAFALINQEIPLIKNFDYILIVRKEKLNFKNCTQELNQLIKLIIKNQ